ncbi:MAG: DegT/DnrJ/EryC1/StrS family aminotransferase [Phycisphaerales bacterium]|nr:DegT/DnrJ/EryC1/StrS family aminotransferase [Phycisphaerales bacterium]
MNVPLLDLKAQYNTLRDELEPIVRGVVEDQWFIMGPQVAEFEKELADYVGVKHAIGCASGSDALLLALMAHGVSHKPGQPVQRVICPAYTFFSTAGSVSRLGAEPVFADIDPVTYNMDIKHTRELAKKTENLAAIIPVHLFGQSIDMDAWIALGEELGVPIIEDAAQSLGTKDATGTPVGSRGSIGCFSFFPSKNLGAFGDGGALTTNDDELAEKLRILRVHGGKPKYYHSVIGVNSRLDALQAAILRVKLGHLDNWHAKRIENAHRYTNLFAEHGALDSATPLSVNTDAPAIRTPTGVEDPARHIYNQYVIRVPAAIRDDLREELKSKNIGNEVYYPVPLHLQECFADLGGAVGDLPHSELAAHETIALPVFPELTDQQARYVVETVVAYVNQHAPQLA